MSRGGIISLFQPHAPQGANLRGAALLRFRRPDAIRSVSLAPEIIALESFFIDALVLEFVALDFPFVNHVFNCWR